MIISPDSPAGVAITVLAALDGLWLWWVLGLNNLTTAWLTEQKLPVPVLRLGDV